MRFLILNFRGEEVNTQMFYKKKLSWSVDLKLLTISPPTGLIDVLLAGTKYMCIHVHLPNIKKIGKVLTVDGIVQVSGALLQKKEKEEEEVGRR